MSSTHCTPCARIPSWWTHFVVVNTVVGAATGDDRVICCNPDNTDTTIIDKVGDRLHVAGYSLDEISDSALVTHPAS